MNPLTHVAIIMDGNGRWGLKHKKSRNAGHKAGLNAIEKIIKETVKQKIKFPNPKISKDPTLKSAVFGKTTYIYPKSKKELVIMRLM